MPTYDYRCDNCEHAFELFQSITASPARKCPQCGKMKLRRLLGTGAGVIFKGSGFYETDYRSDSYRKAADSEKPKSDSSSKDNSKKDTAKAETAKTSDASTPSKSKGDSAKKSA